MNDGQGKSSVNRLVILDYFTTFKKYFDCIPFNVHEEQTQSNPVYFFLSISYLFGIPKYLQFVTVADVVKITKEFKNISIFKTKR